MTDPAALYAQLVTAFNHSKWQEALELATQLLPSASQHAGVHYIAGAIHMQLQHPALAVDYLCRATKLDPTRPDFSTLYAKALLAIHLPRDARLEADRAMALKPQDATTLGVLGMIYAHSQAHEHAAKAFALAVSAAPESATHRLNYATALTATGDIETAEIELETCIRLNVKSWNAHLLLSQLQHQTIESNHLERLHNLLKQHKDNNDAEIFLNMAIAKEYEDLEKYSKAFVHTAQGKSAGRASRPYSIKRDNDIFEMLIRVFSEPMPPNSTGNPCTGPIFVIGMPRSGTTLVERILTSHPDVYAAGELQSFAIALQQSSNSQIPFLLDPQIADRTRIIDWEELGTRYLTLTPIATTQKSRFVDKMPHNFLYAGFIANALPNAKIVCMRRDPIDTCLSNFRHFFAHRSIHLDYSFDLLDIGRYFILFDRLMAHWKRVLPGRIFEMSYEALVQSQESCSRDLLKYCDLTWNSACMHFEENESPVATLSSQQVRNPMFHSSIGRWKHYEHELSDLRDLLLSANIDSPL